MQEGSHVIADVRSLVEIPSEGTLSKVVHRAHGLRYVAFAFDEGQELTEHTASVPAILQVLQGRLRVTVGDMVHDLEPGGLVHLAPRAPHAVAALTPTILLITMISGE